MLDVKQAFTPRTRELIAETQALVIAIETDLDDLEYERAAIEYHQELQEQNRENFGPLFPEQ